MAKMRVVDMHICICMDSYLHIFIFISMCSYTHIFTQDSSGTMYYVQRRTAPSETFPSQGNIEARAFRRMP